MNVIPTWTEKTTDKEAKDGAYAERNMLACLLVKMSNMYARLAYGGHIPKGHESGWYAQQGDEYDGWSRVISLDGGAITFHVPDSFDIGDMPEIKPNWDGHTTEQKWAHVNRLCNMNKGE